MITYTCDRCLGRTHDCKKMNRLDITYFVRDGDVQSVHTLISKDVCKRCCNHILAWFRMNKLSDEDIEGDNRE